MYQYKSHKNYVYIPRYIVENATAKELGVLRLLYHYDGFVTKPINVNISYFEKTYGIDHKTIMKHLTTCASKHFILLSKKDKFYEIEPPEQNYHKFYVDYRDTLTKMSECSLTEHGVYIKLLYYANYYSGVCYPSLKTLSVFCGVQRRQLITILKHLTTLGVISRQQRFNDTILYTVNDRNLVGNIAPHYGKNCTTPQDLTGIIAPSHGNNCTLTKSINKKIYYQKDKQKEELFDFVELLA